MGRCAHRKIYTQTYIETRFMHKHTNILRAGIQTQIDRQMKELIEWQIASKCI